MVPFLSKYTITAWEENCYDKREMHMAFTSSFWVIIGLFVWKICCPLAKKLIDRRKQMLFIFWRIFGNKPNLGAIVRGFAYVSTLSLYDDSCGRYRRSSKTYKLLSFQRLLGAVVASITVFFNNDWEGRTIDTQSVNTSRLNKGKIEAISALTALKKAGHNPLYCWKIHVFVTQL